MTQFHLAPWGVGTEVEWTPHACDKWQEKQDEIGISMKQIEQLVVAQRVRRDRWDKKLDYRVLRWIRTPRRVLLRVVLETVRQREPNIRGKIEIVTVLREDEPA